MEQEKIIRGVQISRRPDGTAYLWVEPSIVFDWADLRSEFTIDDIDCYDDDIENCAFADIVAQPRYVAAYMLEFSICQNCNQLKDYTLENFCTCTHKPVIINGGPHWVTRMSEEEENQSVISQIGSGNGRDVFFDFCEFNLGQERSHVAYIANLKNSDDKELHRQAWDLFYRWRAWRKDFARNTNS